jgi:hypothetical protein
MAKKSIPLYEQFQPEKYFLELKSDAAKLIITGQKLAPPSKRIALHQKNLKIISSRITAMTKQGPREHEVARINHLPSFQEVRLHTKELLYPGDYEIFLEYKLDPQKANQFKSDKPSRELLPSIDEPGAWANAAVELKL